jgi:hypothetical protein
MRQLRTSGSTRGEHRFWCSSTLLRFSGGFAARENFFRGHEPEAVLVEDLFAQPPGIAVVGVGVSRLHAGGNVIPIDQTGGEVAL